MVQRKDRNVLLLLKKVITQDKCIYLLRSALISSISSRLFSSSLVNSYEDSFYIADPLFARNRLRFQVRK